MRKQKKQLSGAIYTLTCSKSLLVIYVGATVHSLKTRFQLHKTTIKSGRQPLYKYIREVGEQPTIEILEEFLNLSKEDIFKLENYWIDQLRQWGFPLKNVANNSGFIYPKKKKKPFKYFNVRVPLSIDRELRKMKKESGVIIHYIIEDALRAVIKENKSAKDIGKGDIPLPADFVDTQNISFVDPFGKEHPLK